MDRFDPRLSLVRLLITHRPGWMAQQIVEEAAILTDFVLGPADAKTVDASAAFFGEHDSK